MNAKVYGGRWKIIGSLSSGGQAEVFKVLDLQCEHVGELVLKRVRNPKRHDRFRKEVAAIKRLQHPNVIQLLDHSALSDDNQAPDTQFLVMPYAHHGDLSDRVALYTNNPDSIVKVAKSAAIALHAAHDVGIVHRDVKPENILFPSAAHDIWLADFGICLIRDLDRGTPADEVVGPVQFMAPELEGGGQLDVAPAADIYSLGKVIYYMLSGGVVLPRERLNEPQYAAVFTTGERQRLIERLLTRMVCPRSSRLSSMTDVIDELDRISTWERDARLLPISPKALADIDEMKRKALEVRRQRDANAVARTRRDAAVAATFQGIAAWFKAELSKAAALIAEGDLITAGVRVVQNETNSALQFGNLRPVAAVEMWAKNTSESFQQEHFLRFNIGIARGRAVVTTRILTGREASMVTPPDEPEDSDLVIWPSYGRKLHNTMPSRPTEWRFLTVDGGLHQAWTNNQVQTTRQLAVGATSQRPVKVQPMKVSTAEWPAMSGSFPIVFQSAVSTFITAMNSGGLFL